MKDDTQPEPCKHLELEGNIEMDIDVETERWVARLRIGCKTCGQPMKFIGMSPGHNSRGPACSSDHIEARLPIQP